MKSARIVILTICSLLAFAANSLLCRLALRQTGIDAASFTFVRILAGASALFALAIARDRRPLEAGNWLSAFALFAYAAAFSFAYLSLSAGTGALLLFGAVQVTMILWGWRHGERLVVQQLAGFAVAVVGLVVLLLPGISAPPWKGSVLMLVAGVAWGVYSLRGKSAADPIGATGGNFLRASVFAAVLSLAFCASIHLDLAGVGYAILSGAITSGLGYVIWYSALPDLKATNAATVQLSVPLLAAAGGILLLGESLTFRFLFAALAVVGGIALVTTHGVGPRSACELKDISTR